MNRILIALGVAVSVLSSPASAKDSRKHTDPAYQKNINYLAGLSGTQLNFLVKEAASIIAVTERCPALKLTPEGKSTLTVIYILNDVQNKHLTPNPAKFMKAVDVYVDAYRKAARRTDSCRAEKARDPGNYR